MNWKKHCYRAGNHSDSLDQLPAEPDKLDAFIAISRKRIEPWLSAVFQAEHLNLLLGGGLTMAIENLAGTGGTSLMAKVAFGSTHDAAIDAHATASAERMNRGTANIEDQLRSAITLLEGLEVIDAAGATRL